jgi:hypothetical protein
MLYGVFLQTVNIRAVFHLFYYNNVLSVHQTVAFRMLTCASQALHWTTWRIAQDGKALRAGGGEGGGVLCFRRFVAVFTTHRIIIPPF